MNLFSDEARRRRRSMRDRKHHGPAQPLRERLGAAGLAAAASVLIPVAVPFAAEWIRRWIGPHDPGVLLWWPVSESHAALPIFAGVLAAAAFGVGALVRGKAALRRAAWAWLGLGLAAGTSAALSVDSSVRIYADRVVVDDGAANGVLKPGTYPLATADQVVVRCRLINRRRQSDYATVDYSVHFPRGGWIAFEEARPGGPHAARAWFSTLAQVDANALGHAPHAAVNETGVNCIRALRAELGGVDFAEARRMMGLSDADFARYYAEPHEAWRKGASDGL